MFKKEFGTIAVACVSTLIVLAMGSRGAAQEAKQPYPSMAPIEQYLMERTAEIVLARSAAPDAISQDASVVILTRHGYETAVQGKNGWVCMVGRGWGAMFDHPEFWNPKVRAAGCFNPPAVRSVLPYEYKRSELVLAGHSKREAIATIKAAIDKRELPALEQNSLCYMMSKTSYLTDNGDHNGPHIMFYQHEKDDPAWGANVTNSPVLSVNYWYIAPNLYPELRNFPPISVFAVVVDKWSDGTPAPPM
jgi:hypothetical protein